MSFTFQNPFVYVNNPANSNPIGLGKMYIGLPDTDPITPANQIPVYAVQPDGSELEIPQPVRTTAGGVVTYNGTPIQLKINADSYSVRIDSSANAQLFYTARAYRPDADLIERMAEVDSDIVIAGQEANRYFATYDTVSAMQSALTSDYVGRRVQWLGYYALSDGGSGWGVVKSGAHTANGGSIITINTGLYVEQNIKGKSFNLRKFGAKLDGVTNDATQTNRAIEFASSNGIGEIKWAGIIGISSGIIARTGVTLVGEGFSASRIKTLSGFTGNIYETYNFATLQADQTADTSEGCPISYGLENCSIDGLNYTGAVTSTTGYGVRLYGRQLRLKGLLICKTAGIGLYTEFPAIPAYVDFDTITDTKFSVIKDISIEQTGYEGFVFNGPTDQYLDNIFVGWPAGSRFDQYDTTGPKTSLLFPTEQIHGVRILRSTEFGFIHSYDNNYGYAVYIKKAASDPAIRIRGNYLMGERGYGNVYIDQSVRYNINLIETHNNVGGPTVGGPYSAQAGLNPHFSLNSTLGGATKADIWRDGNENGCLGFDFKGSDHDVQVQVFGFSGTFTGGGDGINNEALASKLRAMVVSANNANRMGIGYNEANTVVGSDIDITSRFCYVNVKFNSAFPAEQNNSYKIKCDRAATADIQNPTRIGRYVSKRSDITVNNGINYLSNKFVGSASVDFSSTAIQTVTLTHFLFRAPLEDEITPHLSYDSGSIPPVNWMTVVSANATTLTVEIWFASGGSGTGRLNVNVG